MVAHASTSSHTERSSTAHTGRNRYEPVASAADFSPDHFRREITRRVSYYALFKWWLPLSQHPRCLSNLTSLYT
jgi:hypothetical protein